MIQSYYLQITSKDDKLDHDIKLPANFQPNYLSLVELSTQTGRYDRDMGHENEDDQHTQSGEWFSEVKKSLDNQHGCVA